MVKRILTTLLLLLSVAAYSQTTWYIDPDGSDVSGNGSITKPWASLKHAADTVTFAGDIIHINAGSYTAGEQITLADSVSLLGEGSTSIITFSAALNPGILLQSTLEGTVGNQTISYIYFDGDSTAVRGIAIWKRSKVEIHHCTFNDFLSQGATFRGANNSTGGPIIYSTGNKFYNNIVYECGRYIGGAGTGALEVGGQDGMLVYNNTITVIDKGTAQGYGIKSNADGYNKGLKIYNNTITVPTFENSGYCFTIELWSQRGGIEIYNNTLNGAIDLGGYDTNDDGGYGFAVKIYDNVIGWNEPQTYSTSGIYLELGIHDGVYIYNNEFKNIQYGLRFNVTSNDVVPGMEDIYIYYNTFYNLRTAGAGYTGLVTAAATVSAYNITFDNIQFLNNTIYNPTPGTLAAGFFFAVPGHTYTDIQVRNNIFVNAYSTVKFENSTVTGIDVTNNIFNNCNNTVVYETCTVTDSVHVNNLTSDPDFIEAGINFRLNSGSPAIEGGVDVNLTSDKDGNIVPQGALPDIGAYEFITLPVPTTGLGWQDILHKRNFKDVINFDNTWMIDGIPVTATAAELNALVGQGEIISGIDTLSLSKRIDAKADTSLVNDTIAYYAPLASPTLTGTATTNNLHVDGSAQFGNTGLTIDSIGLVDNRIAFYDGPDTLGVHIIASDIEDLGNVAILLGDTLYSNNPAYYTQRQVDSIMAGFNSWDSTYVYARIDSLVDVVADQASQIALLWAALDSLDLGDFEPPAFLSAEIGNYSDSIIVVLLSDTNVQQDSIPVTGAFTVKENGVNFGVEAIDIGHDTLFVALDSVGTLAKTYTISYNKNYDFPQLQDSSENITASWTNKSVTNNFYPLHADYQTIYDAMAVKPTGDTIEWQNDLIYSLDSAGLWDRVKLLYMPVAASTLADSYHNWAAVNNTSDYTATVGDAPAFDRVVGWDGNGSSDYLNSGLVFGTDSTLVNHAEGIGNNDLTIGVWCTATTKGNTNPLGVTDVAYVAINMILYSGSDTFSGYVNDASGGSLGANATGSGFSMLTRRAHGEKEGYRNGVSTGTDNDESVRLPITQPLYLLANNDRGSAAAFHPDPVAIIIVMDAVSDDESLAIYNIFHHYMTHIGL